jgi:hypothetical protein
MANFKQKKFNSKSGKEYTFQFPGVRFASQISDRIKNKYGVQMEEKLGDELMKHVIVDPKLTWDSFGDDKKEFNEVISAAYLFLEGEDEDEVTDAEDN